METAARRRIDRLGGSPATGVRCLLVPSGTGPAEMSRACTDGADLRTAFRATQLRPAAPIHDGHAMGEMPDDLEIVRDEEIGDAAFPLQLRAAGSRPAPAPRHRAPIPARRNDQARIGDERAGDVDALPLAARISCG